MKTEIMNFTVILFTCIAGFISTIIALRKKEIYWVAYGLCTWLCGSQLMAITRQEQPIYLAYAVAVYYILYIYKNYKKKKNEQDS